MSGFFNCWSSLLVLPLVNIRMQKSRQNGLLFCRRHSFLNLSSLDLTTLQLGSTIDSALCRLELPLGSAEVLDTTCVARGRHRYNSRNENRHWLHPDFLTCQDNNLASSLPLSQLEPRDKKSTKPRSERVKMTWAQKHRSQFQLDLLTLGIEPRFTMDTVINRKCPKKPIKDTKM